MRLFAAILAFAVFIVTFPARGGQSTDSPPPMPPGRQPDEAAREAWAMMHFAPMWMPVFPKFSPSLNFPSASNAESSQVPAYPQTWQLPQWQHELGLSAEQKKKLLAIHAKAVAEAEDHAEQFKKLSPEEQQAQAKAWAGKTPPWRQQLANEVCRQIEAVLTRQQLQTLKDYSFPTLAIGFLYDAKVRHQIGLSQDQEGRFRRIAKERLARFQTVTMGRAEKLWGILTPQQQAALPGLVKRQGPTSAALSIGWEFGFFEIEKMVPDYPMLSTAPARKRLVLSADQEKRLDAIMAEVAARNDKERQERAAGRTQPVPATSDAEADAKKEVEAVLSPQQLATLNEINFRRQVTLALGYPEKRKTVGITPQQEAEFQRLDKETHEQLYRIDREMLGQAMKILTPRQRRQLQTEVDRLMQGDLPLQVG